MATSGQKQRASLGKNQYPLIVLKNSGGSKSHANFRISFRQWAILQTGFP